MKQQILPVKKFVTGFTTNFDGVTFSSADEGAKTLIVSYTEGGTTFTKTYQRQVNSTELLTLVTSLEQICFKARYALGVPASNVAMRTEKNTTGFAKYDATFVNDQLARHDTLQQRLVSKLGKSLISWPYN